MNQIIDLTNEALSAIASVQLFCAENDHNITVYALNSAHNDIDTIKQIVERNGVFTIEKLDEFLVLFEANRDRSVEFDASLFLTEFSEFAEFEGDENDSN